MANAYILVAFGLLCAKASGFLRDAVFASYFGMSIESDIYLQIFGIASLLFTAVGSALSTLVIKNINKTKYSQGEGQKQYASYFLRFISTVIILITAGLYIFSGQIVSLLLPGLSAENYVLAKDIMHIMLPSFLFISVAYIMSGLLQNRRVFFTPSIMSLPYNAAVICALCFGVRDIKTISIVTTLGWFLHIVILLPDFYRKGYRFFVPLKGMAKDSNLRTAEEMLLIFISGMMFQLCFLTDKTIVSCEEGMIATLSYASNLFITLSKIFVVTMSSIVFPAISQNFEHGAMEYVRELIRYIIKLMMSIFVLYLIVVVFFGEDLIRIVYERGEFTAESTRLVSVAFVIYSFGIFGYIAQNVLNKLFYIAGKYKLTVIGAVVIVVLKLLIDIFVSPYFSTNFVAISTTVLVTVYAAFIVWQLKNIIGSYLTRELIGTVLKILMSAFLTVVSIAVTNCIVPMSLSAEKFGFLIPLGVGLAVYAVSMLVTGVLHELLTTPLSKIK